MKPDWISIILSIIAIVIGITSIVLNLFFVLTV